MPKLSRKELCVESLPKLTDALAKNEEFCSIVAMLSPDRAGLADVKRNYVSLCLSVCSSQNFEAKIARTIEMHATRQSTCSFEI
jgi:hypothetical protein